MIPMHPHDEKPYSYCPQCGGGLEIRALRPNEPGRLVCVRCGFIFYLDPKVAVGTIITDDASRIVLVRRAIQPGYGLWVFPGGYVDRGEEVRGAAVREAREECGLDVRLDRLLDVYSYEGSPVIIIVFAASMIGGELCAADKEECLEAGLFRADEIPWDELAFHSTRDALRDYLDRRVL